MTPERWQQIDQWLEGALELPAAKRGAWLAQACAGDAALQREVLVLLERHRQP